MLTINLPSMEQLKAYLDTVMSYVFSTKWIEGISAETFLKIYIVIIGIVILIYILHEIDILIKDTQIRKNISSGKFIYYRDFEKNWIISKSGRKGRTGYKYNDGPGCYVITIYDYYVDDGNYKKYDDIYIG